jgi:LacI family gluconate utilization system Gnt-I transcriptional repressor
VPEQIRVAGFGDDEIAGLSVPSLTTINPHPRKIGAETARAIMDAFDGRATSPATVQIIPELAIRQSAG